MRRVRKVIVIGLDGLEPSLVEGMLAAEELPNLARIRTQGGYGRVATTTPAQTPVAWSTFATGVNPGGHGIFDFLRRDPRTYLPDLGFTRYERERAFLPPKAVNLRGGEALWTVLSRAGIPSIVQRCPCTFPPDELRGRMLSGMGVPDLRGGLGTSTFYCTEPVAGREAEEVVVLSGTAPIYRAPLTGPRHPSGRENLTVEVRIEVDAERRLAVIRAGQRKDVEARLGEWSDWLRVRFRAGPLTSAAGMVRFLLVRLAPRVELYASPVNFDPAAPLFPVSHPWEYAAELAGETGLFYTAGMVEDHTGLSNGRFGEAAFLAQCEDVMREREAMMQYELARMTDGFFFCLFDTPDRVQHMFWRFGEPDHPANRADGAAGESWRGVIADHYRRCDAVVGRALEAVDDETLIVVLSDHGFGSFRRGVHLNAWLRSEGWLALKPGVDPEEDAGDFLRQVDWSRTRAYALGLGSIYLNVRGREGEGIVRPDEADALAADIARRLTGFVDPETGSVAVRGAWTARELYRGPHSADAPEVVVGFARGYRVSWATALGGVPAALVEDNVRKWGGDHIIDPALVPGVLFMNRPFHAGAASLVDLAPTTLAALGVGSGARMEGRNLMTDDG